MGVLGGFFAASINSLTLWITSALYGGYAAANVLKWIWWRFNGYGYFFGMLGGLVASTFVPILFPETAAIYLFPLILLISFLGCFLGTYFHNPDDMDILKNFYRQTKPWGFWKPVIAAIKKEDPDFIPNQNFKADLVNVIIGIVWQMTLVIMPIYLLIGATTPLMISLLVFCRHKLVVKKILV